MQEGRGGGGHGEVSGGGAVAVVVAGEGGLGEGLLFLGADQLVLVGVDGCLVGFDGLDGPPGQSAQLVGGEPLCLVHEHRFDGRALLVADPGGQFAGGADDDRGVRRGEQAFVECGGGGVVPGVGGELARRVRPDGPRWCGRWWSGSRPRPRCR